MFDASAMAQGFVLGLAMFVSPGPKDVLILRQSLLRRPAAELIAVGTLSDALLIGLGMAGASAALNRAPALQVIALWIGVSLLLVHGLLAARRALFGSADVTEVAQNSGAPSPGKSLAALLVVSFLNPVAWLDTVLVIGMVGAALPAQAQLSFAAGAIAASLAWFSTLVVGARGAGQWLTAPTTWRVLEGCVAVLMFGLALRVAPG